MRKSAAHWVELTTNTLATKPAVTRIVSNPAAITRLVSKLRQE